MKYDGNLWYILQGQTLSQGEAFVVKKSQGQKPWAWQLQLFIMHFYTYQIFGVKDFCQIPFFCEKNFVAETTQKSPKIANYHKLSTKVSILKVFLYHTLKFHNNNNKLYH